MAAVPTLTPETSNGSLESNNEDDIFSLIGEAGIQACLSFGFDEHVLISLKTKWYSIDIAW